MAKKKDESAVTTPINNETGSSDRLALLKSRLKIAKLFCKKPHDAWKKWISEYEIEDVEDTDEIRDKVRIGYIFRKTEQEMPSVFDDQPELFIKGRNNLYKALEPGFNALYDHLWDIQNLEEKIEDVGLYFILLGMGFIDSPWTTKTKKVKDLQDVEQPVVDELGQPIIDEMGQPAMQMVKQEVEYEVPIIDNPDAKVRNPFKVYFSPETEFNTVLDYDHCPYLFYEETTTKEAIKAEYGKDVEASEKLHVGDTEIDTEIENEIKEQKDDFKRVTKYHYYGVLPEGMVKDIEASEPWRYDKDYHVIFTNNEELKVEESPYEVKPCFVIGNYGLANKFFKFGDAKHLMPLVKELEQYRSQILKHTRKMANPKPLIEINSEVDENAFSDPRVGKAVKYANIPPQYLSPAQLGSEVSVGIEMARTDLEKTSPSFDLAGGGGQSQVKSPRGIQVYSEASDRGVRRKRKKIARLIRHLIIFQFSQVGQNWDPMSLSKIGLEENADPNALLEALQDPSVLNRIDVEIESLSVNRVQMRQDALDLFDLASKFPNVFNLVEIARDVLQNGFNKRDADRYMISMDQMNQQAVQQFIQALGQQNPELAAQLMQYMQQPNMAQIEGGDTPPQVREVDETMPNMGQI